MLAALQTAWALRKWIALGVLLAVIGGLWVYARLLDGRRATAEAAALSAQTEVTRLAEINDQNTAALAAIKRDQAASDAAVTAALAARRTSEARYAGVKEQLDALPKGGCVGPRVAAVLDSLRQQAN